ncbi:dTDP-4-dehydrorhamnose 3,5-epimerase [uncultured Desulfobacter sp.]|uniref:dTDP-4-dehydrorhamnose 3,5-epimerase n=1 Tax=uncultured Desulfobacter sp. TaxID=240139 RepID=UPI002AAC1293|nr:dTDP-4-dehydrorhamnose 3,5-epimerase [uncultured Desulfobacter sp.]
MDSELMPGVLLTPLNRIRVDKGDILHAAKVSDPGIKAFGEAYFSIIRSGEIKAWKRHRDATLNLIVPVGEIRFVLYDDRLCSAKQGETFSVILSLENYYRLTVPPMLWMGFQGVGPESNMLLNIADIPHDPDEADRLDVDCIGYDWTNK